MLNLILPILLASTIHLWNATSFMQHVIVTTPKGVVELDVAGYSEMSVPTIGTNTTATVNGASAAWTVIDGVTFNAAQPKSEWLIPSTSTTGLMISNPNDRQVFFDVMLHRFDGAFKIQHVSIAANASIAFFVPILFGGDGLGTVIVVALEQDPIVVSAARCDSLCVSVPVY